LLAVIPYAHVALSDAVLLAMASVLSAATHTFWIRWSSPSAAQNGVKITLLSVEVVQKEQPENSHQLPIRNSKFKTCCPSGHNVQAILQ
jgi:hypothetical protein